MTPEHLRPTQAISSTEKRLSNTSAVKDLFKIRNLEKKKSMQTIQEHVKCLDRKMLKFIEACVLRGAAWRI